MLGTERLVVPRTAQAALAYSLPTEGAVRVVDLFWARRHAHGEVDLRPVPSATEAPTSLEVPTLPESADADGAPTKSERRSRKD